MAVRFVSGSKVGRALASAVLTIVLLAATLQAAEPSSPPADLSIAVTPLPTAAPAVSGLGTGPMASVTTPVSADPRFRDEILALGLDEATAAFMAQTLSTVDVTDAHTFVVHHEMPSGAVADETYHLVRGSGINPDDPPTIVYEVVGDELHYQLRYAIDPAELPDDLRTQVMTGLPVLAETGSSTTTGSIRLLGLAPVGPMRGTFVAEAPGTAQAIVDGVISQGKGTAIGKFVKFGEKQGFTKSAASYKAFKAGKKVWEAVEANDLITDALDTLKALRECAENPTNPLTQQQHGEDPEARQKVLDELTAVENDIRASTVVMFTTMLASTGSSLVKAAPWLGFITTPASNYVKQTNQYLIEDRVRAAADLVVPCQRSVRMVGGAGDLKVDAVVCDISKPFTVTGGKITLDFTPSPRDPLRGGTYTYRGDFGRFQIAGDGTYRVKLTAAGGSLIASGPGSAITERGTHSNEGEEHYDLTPVDCQ
jgi:hypothetical protein